MSNQIVGVLITLIVSLSSTTVWQSAAASKARRAVMSINFPGMPVLVDSGSLETTSENTSELTYRLRNESGEQVQRVNLRAFVVDTSGKIVHTEVGINREVLDVKGEVKSIMRVSRDLKEGQRAYVCVEGVVGRIGRWRIDSHLLERLKVISSADLPLQANFEPHLDLSIQDKRELLSLVLTDISQDKTKRDLVGEPTILRTDDLDPTLTDLAVSRFLFLSSAQIRELAQTNGSLKYLEVESLKAEGASTEVRIFVRDQPSRYPVIRVAVTRTLVFRCVRSTGKWTIESFDTLVSSGE